MSISPVETTSTSTASFTETKPKPREYTVLRKSGANTFEIVRTVEAHSAEAAVRKAAEILIAAGTEGALTLVAVTAARFNPVTVTTEVKTQLKLS